MPVQCPFTLGDKCLVTPEALKQSIQHFAAECGTSTHAFMLQTLESEVKRRKPQQTTLMGADRFTTWLTCTSGSRHASRHGVPEQKSKTLNR